MYLRLWFVLFTAISFGFVFSSNTIGTESYESKHDEQVIILGPGFDSPESIILPTRYLFVLHRRPIDSINIHIITPEDVKNYSDRCHLWTQTFNETNFCIRLPNGTHSNELHELLEQSVYCNKSLVQMDEDEYQITIVRYRLFQISKCLKRRIELQIYHNQSIIYRKSFSNNRMLNLFSDHCDCVQDDWPKLLKCQTNLANVRLMKQIEHDLKPFSNGIDFDIILNETIHRFGPHERTYAFCLYQILSNQLYRKCFGEYVGFARFYDEILLSLLRKVSIPDVEFIANLGDWPLSLKNNGRMPIPIFSWCGNKRDSYDIVLPTYELTESILHAQERISVDIFSTFGRQPFPFESKLNRLFWRGRDSNRARLKLIDISRNDPTLYNVSITNFFFFRDEMDQYMNQDENPSNETRRTIPYVSFFDFFLNRYQINIDGTVAAYRFPFLLAGNSLILKQESIYYEFFYHLLSEGEHYISVKENLENLSTILNRLMKSNDPNIELQSKRIIWNARKFVLQHLLPENIYCYYYNVLEQYSKLLLKSKPIQQRPEMELIFKDSIDPFANDCKCESRRHDEL
ncbi:Protein O-glucosyltransferase 2 [Blomia tropicalis]|nr:Protein O-glucosyltransferase 2 [Blomia tropicalis]